MLPYPVGHTRSEIHYSSHHQLTSLGGDKASTETGAMPMPIAHSATISKRTSRQLGRSKRSKGSTRSQQIPVLDRLVRRGQRSKPQIVYMVSPAMNHVWLVRMERTNIAMGLDSGPCVHSERQCITSSLVAHGGD